MIEGNLITGWKLLSIPEVCVINPPRPRNLPYSDEAMTSFLPMAAVDDRQGKIIDLQTRPFGEIKRGYTYFEENDVLFAKITPCMENGKAAIARELINGFGFGSTEFHVLRPHNGYLPEWIYYFVRREPFRQEAKTNFRGAVGQQRVPKGFLENHLIPIPYPDNPEKSLATQILIISRIKSLYHEIEEARRLHEKIVTDTNQLMDAVLADTFSNLKEMQTLTIDDFTEVKGGKRLPKGEDFAPEKTLYPYIRVTDFEDFSINPSKIKYLAPELQQRIQRYTINSDDVYISIAGTIGTVGTIPKEFSGSNLTENAAKIMIKPEFKSQINIQYLVYYLASQYGKAQIKERTKMAGQPKLALTRIKTITVPLPEKSIQDHIVYGIRQLCKEINQTQKTNSQMGNFINQLEQSILAQAFRGEL